MAKTIAEINEKIKKGQAVVVTAELMEKNPDLVDKLVKVTQRATDWINSYPAETAEIMARQLQVAGEKFSLAKQVETTANLEISPEVMSHSMNRVKYATSIDLKVVQETIGYVVEPGYLKEEIEAAEILDLRYLQGE